MRETTKSKARARFGWALAIPILVSFVFTSVFGIKARRAFEQQRCGLGLPWDRATSESWLEAYFPAAWRDVQTLRRLSSECFAALHTDLTTAGLVAFAATAVLAVLLVAQSGILSGDVLRPGNSNRLEIAIGSAACAVFTIWWIVWSLSNDQFINFGERAIRWTVIFNGEYIAPFNFAFLLNSVSLRIVVVVLLVFVSLSWRGSVGATGPRQTRNEAPFAMMDRRARSRRRTPMPI
ncbi:hypothetical protein AB4Z40_28390 [Bosea sp. 2YAB26]|uniref:hypothetical protein n=2 Tax=Pseudomonadota TaxID=1224 RepID=UPI003F8FFEF3